MGPKEDIAGPAVMELFADITVSGNELVTVSALADLASISALYSLNAL